MNGDSSAKWLKISLDCPATILEAITDLLGILSGSGVEQSPILENRCTVSGFFCLDRSVNREQILLRLEREIGDLCSLYNITPPEPVCSVMDDQDWATSWQQFFKPFAVVPGLIIKPSWEAYEAAEQEQVIQLDPGMAFGTGLHASTRLALAFIHDCFQNNPPQKVLDVGTGTGILAIAASLFGAGSVVAVDNDPEAVRVATENIAGNGLEGSIHISATDLAEIRGGFDLICANIVHDVLVEMAPVLGGLLLSQGRLVLAGILTGEQENSIISLYRSLGIRLVQANHEDEWASLLLTATG